MNEKRDAEIVTKFLAGIIGLFTACLTYACVFAVVALFWVVIALLFMAVAALFGARLRMRMLMAGIGLTAAIDFTLLYFLPPGLGSVLFTILVSVITLNMVIQDCNSQEVKDMEDAQRELPKLLQDNAEKHRAFKEAEDKKVWVDEDLGTIPDPRNEVGYRERLMKSQMRGKV